MKEELKKQAEKHQLNYLSERRCSQCGKNIAMMNPEKWVYKREMFYKTSGHHKTLYFCSWGCLRAWENGKKAVRK